MDEVVAVRKRGRAREWAFLHSYESEDLLLQMVRQMGLLCIRSAYSLVQRTDTYKCHVRDCPKIYRHVCKFQAPQPDMDDFLGQYSWYEERGTVHMHDMADVPLRGLTEAQKEIVLFCERRNIGKPTTIISEFQRRATENIQANVQVVPTPSVAMISNFLSNERKRRRGNINVGGVTLYDLESYCQQKRYGKYYYVINIFFN